MYGPAFSLPAGEFFCPSQDGEESTAREQAYNALVKSNESGIWSDNSTLLLNNPRPGFCQWSRQSLETEWHSFMKGRYTNMQSKTNGLVTQSLPMMKTVWVTQAEKDKWKDATSDTQAVLLEKKEHRNFIKAIKDFEENGTGYPRGRTRFNEDIIAALRIGQV